MSRPNSTSSRLAPWRLAWLFPALSLTAWGATPPPMNSSVVQPARPPAVTESTVTVTPAMGDPGGKFFGRTPDPAKTRHYYIAAEPVLWDFAPLGEDPVCGATIPSSLLLNRTSWKIRYVQYRDAGFAARVLPDPRLGLMGPVLRGMTGEFIAVTFLNRAWLPLSMHPHGVKYDRESEGSYSLPNPGHGAAVAPGAQFTYVWQLDASSGPRSDEPSSKAWLYHSHATGDGEENLGLIGFIVVTDPARARPDGTPKDVDREMGVLFKIFEEEAVEEEEARTSKSGATPPARPPRTWAERMELEEANQRLTLNGLAFGNLRGLTMNEGERVRWYLFGLGSEEDFHTAHWHGLRAVEEGRRGTDVVELLPGSMKVADTIADNPGDWLLHCHVAEHMVRGMFARFTVYGSSQIGVSREPADAFFGLRTAERSLIIDTARYAPGELVLAGRVAVPDSIAIHRETFRIQLGGKSIRLQPDAGGQAAAPDALLAVKNVSSDGSGHVSGGSLEFEVTLRGPEWDAELRRLKAAPDAGGGVGPAVAVGLQVGSVQHSAEAAFKRVPKL